MGKKNYGITRIIFLLASIFLNPRNTQKKIKSINRNKFYIPNAIADIPTNTFIITDISYNPCIYNNIKKCMPYANVAFLRIDNLKKANIYICLGLTNLRGIFYFRNSMEVIDVRSRQKCKSCYNNPDIVKCWDLYIFSMLLQFKEFFDAFFFQFCNRYMTRFVLKAIHTGAVIVF